MMKYRFLILTFFAALLVGCKENQWMDWKAQNDLWLEQNITAHQNDPNFHVLSDGLQDRIIADPGAINNEVQPNADATVTCDYTGTLINGYEFDYGNGVTFGMSNLVSGFSEALRKIHQHGDIEIFVPYYLGYDEEVFTNDKIGDAEGNGTEGTQSYIPPYSVMIFTVHLSSVSN